MNSTKLIKMTLLFVVMLSCFSFISLIAKNNDEKNNKEAIAEIQKKIEQFEKTESEMNSREEKLNLFIQNINVYLKSKGYSTGTASFSMKSKNSWHLNFSDNAYLNNKKLPEDITNELFKQYRNSFKTTEIFHLSIPEGLEPIDKK